MAQRKTDVGTSNGEDTILAEEVDTLGDILMYFNQHRIHVPWKRH